MSIKDILDKIDFTKPAVKMETPEEPTKPVLTEEWEQLLRYAKDIPELHAFLSWLAGLGAELSDGHPRPLGYHQSNTVAVKRICINNKIFSSVLPLEIDIYPEEEDLNGSKLH